jgi:hypothetical protein
MAKIPMERKPLQVSLEFKKKLDELQRKIMLSRGEKPSLRKLTEDIIASPLFDDIEKSLIKSGNLKMDIKIKFDGRAIK